MKYVGSKNRLAKELVPIIQSHIDEYTRGYLEPFVGGANMIDKIECKKKIGCDIHKELIALLKYSQNLDNKLPLTISKDEYIKVRNNKENYPSWYVGLVGFCASYNGKYFGGYAGETKTKGGIRHYDKESIKNLEKQRKNLQNIIFANKSFQELPKEKIKNYVIYCDIPYKNTLKYKTNPFPYDEFYQWCKDMAKDNIVLVSEYSMPNRFECVWEKEHKTHMNQEKSKRIERLFIAR